MPVKLTFGSRSCFAFTIELGFWSRWATATSLEQDAHDLALDIVERGLHSFKSDQQAGAMMPQALSRSFSTPEPVVNSEPLAFDNSHSTLSLSGTDKEIPEKAANDTPALANQEDKAQQLIEYVNESCSKDSTELTGAPTNVDHLARCPPEVRALIFEILMVADKPIRNAHKNINRCYLLSNTGAEKHGIDANILRTSKIYCLEGTPILYGQNEFEFQNVQQIQNFAIDKLEIDNGLRKKPYGRLTLIRKAIIHLGSKHELRSSIENLAQEWQNFFQARSGHWYKARHGGFPSLQSLQLHFVGWRLRKEHVDGIATWAIIKKFKESGHGLSSLAITGLYHEDNLRHLCRELVEEGGEMAYTNENGEVVRQIVRHADK